jgi:hypothetical protein
MLRIEADFGGLKRILNPPKSAQIRPNPPKIRPPKVTILGSLTNFVGQISMNI